MGRRVHVRGKRGGMSVRPGVLRVEVDPDRQEIRAHGSDHEPVEPPADPVKPDPRVVVGQDGGGPGPPSSTDLHPHPRIGLEVADVVGAAAVLGDDPERVAVETVADRVPARAVRSAAGRLEERMGGRDNAQREQGAYRRIQKVFLREPNSAGLSGDHVDRA
jgi:hypothetical protein